MDSDDTGFKELFFKLFDSPNEDEVEKVIENNPEIFSNENWHPLGGDERMFGIVRGQQSNPIAALVEKVTNSIDALLTRKCYEAGINPESDEAPRTMEDAINRFFPEHKNWDMQNFRRDRKSVV